MRPARCRAVVAQVVVITAALGLTGAASAQEPLEEEVPLQAPAATKEDAESDNPTRRLEASRASWGLVTPAFRETVLREGAKHSFKKNAPGPRWVNIGPTGARYAQNGSFTGHVRDSGRARTVLPHPTNPEVVYVLSSGGGLWRTSNWSSPALRWEALTDDLPTTGGGAVAFGRNPNTLFLGLGDPYDQILVGGAMVRSTNGGVTWGAMVALGGAVSVRDVKVDSSTNLDVVLAATDRGLFRSVDEGLSYAAVPAFAGLSVWSLVRTSAGWLASAQPCPAEHGGLQCPSPSTLFLSTDRGATWAPVSNPGNVFAGAGRTTLAVGLPGDAVVYAYAATVGDGAMRDVFRSPDGGQSWTANGVNATKAPANPTGAHTTMNICRAQCWYNQLVLVDPRDPTRNTVWIGGDFSSARSRDGGASWRLMTWWLFGQAPALPYAHADFHAGAFKLTGTPSLILGNDGGLNVTEDDGATFTSDKNSGLVTHLYYTVSGNAKLPNLVIGGTQDNGTRLRTDNGTLHDQVLGGDGLGAAYSQENTNTVFASVQGAGLRTNLSNNAPTVAQNWATATGGLADGAGTGFYTAIVPAPAGLDPTGRVFFHFSNSRVWRTDNGGLSWTRIGSATAPLSPGLPATRRFRSSPYNLGVSPTSLQRIAVGADGGFMVVTADGGASWTDIDLVQKVPGYVGFISNVTWEDDHTLWVTATPQAAGSVRVVRATIAPGASWASAVFEPRQSGLPDLPVNRVLFDPRDATRRTLYAATHVGVYATTDGGLSWAPFGNGLPTVRVNDLYMPPDGAFLRIATYGRGIWQLSQLELAGAVVADGVRSCDADGVLDNGETGTLTLTLKNQGLDNVSQVSVRVTSSNPALTFPQGNVLAFPPVQKGGTSTGTLRVALAGAAPVAVAELALAVDAPELGLGGPLLLTTAHRLNHDERQAASSVELANTARHAWTVSGHPEVLPNVQRWQQRVLSPTQSVWWGPDNNGRQDDLKAGGPDEQVLTSPPLRVGGGPLTVSFSHRFSFEAGSWDGGVVELSKDGGATWVDIGTGAYNGLTSGVTLAPIGAGRPAFVNRMAGWPSFAPVTLNLGTAWANETVRLRFRIGADELAGAPGWEVGNLQVSGLVDTPFTALVPNAVACPAP